MEENNEKLTRKGIHKYFHASKLDTYVFGISSIGFLVIVTLKIVTRLGIFGTHIRFITGADALQIGLLFAILGYVSHMYYLKYEKHYEK